MYGQETEKREIRSAFAFRSIKKELCQNCISDIIRFNNDFVEGAEIKCLVCSNRLLMTHFDSTQKDSMAFGLSKSNESYSIEAEHVVLDNRIYPTAEHFDALKERMCLGDGWQIVNNNQPNRNSFSRRIDSSRVIDKMYAPLRGGVALLCRMRK